MTDTAITYEALQAVLERTVSGLEEMAVSCEIGHNKAAYNVAAQAFRAFGSALGVELIARTPIGETPKCTCSETMGESCTEHRR